MKKAVKETVEIDPTLCRGCLAEKATEFYSAAGNRVKRGLCKACHEREIRNPGSSGYFHTGAGSSRGRDAKELQHETRRGIFGRE